MNTPLYYRLGTPWLRIHAALRAFAPRQKGFRILTFHDVFEDQFKSFERLLDHVTERHGILSPQDVESIVNGSAGLRDDGRVPCLITFDDGYISDAIVARRILNDRGIKAVYFVCPTLMDVPKERQNAVIFERIYEGQRIPSHRMFMGWDDLSALAAGGHTIGSHTLSHRRLSAISRDERKREIFESAEILQKRLGQSIRWFAYPFGNLGSIDAESYTLIRSRYEFCCTGLRGLNTMPVPRFALLREPVDPLSPFDYQRLSLSGGLDFMYSRPLRRLMPWASSGK
jgi:peptidoglycan/xylan/chitin deacetylase (PgdA/CDA1 family)